MIRTLLFDMGNVLVHFSHERMCRQMAHVCRVDPAAVRELLLETDMLADFERGRLSEADVHQRFEAQFGGPIDAGELVRAGSDIFTLNDPIVPVLDALKLHGHRLVLLSNTSISHLNWIRSEFDVLDRFDALVTSCGAGAIKPDPAIFAAALAAIECAPQECFYTDDIPAYVQAGRDFGLQAEVFTHVNDLRGHLALRGVELP